MKILVITHSDAYPDNAVTRDLIDQGHEIFWRRPLHGEQLPELSGPMAVDAAVSFGGPQFVTEIDQMPWMQKEAAWIRAFVEGGGNFLGICLGAQILSHAFGGRIWRHADETSEIGVYQVSPTPEAQTCGFLREPSAFYQWHLEGFDCPPCAKPLASSNLFPNQAFKLGERSYGLQFHPEITEDMIKRWTTTVLEIKPEMFERPQVRFAETHLPDWKPQAERIASWRRDFLKSWLAA